MLIKNITQQAGTLGIAQAVAATGEAMDQPDLLRAAAVYGHAAKNGVLLGAVFGAAQGIISGETLGAMAARVGFGMAGLDVAALTDHRRAGEFPAETIELRRTLAIDGASRA